MVKEPNFRYLPEVSSDATSNCPIEITKGQFAGIIYRYGKISLEELDDGSLNVTINIEIIKAPENFDKNTKEFTNTIGEIFSEIVEDGIEQEPIDLEDDVHHD